MNVNGVNTASIGWRLAEWLKKHYKLLCLPETNLYTKIHRLRAIRWTKMYHADSNQKRAGLAILMSDFTNYINFMKELLLGKMKEILL